jgi:hypothetical protein
MTGSGPPARDANAQVPDHLHNTSVERDRADLAV